MKNPSLTVGESNQIRTVGHSKDNFPRLFKKYYCHEGLSIYMCVFMCTMRVCMIKDKVQRILKKA